MNEEEARASLVAALREVRKAFDDGADDWQYRLLRTFREYIRAIDVEAHLLDPLERMLLENTEATFKARRQAAGKTGTPMPINRKVALSTAAAAVTVLKERGECGSVSDAEKLVARWSGISAREIKTFRDHLNRGTYGAAVHEGHEKMLAEIRSWPTDGMKSSLSRLKAFVS